VWTIIRRNSRARVAPQLPRKLETGFAPAAYAGNETVGFETTGALETISHASRRDQVKSDREQTDAYIHGRGIFVINEQW
jgi:hypothetical protein